MHFVEDPGKRSPDLRHKRKNAVDSRFAYQAEQNNYHQSIELPPRPTRSAESKPLTVKSASLASPSKFLNQRYSSVPRDYILRRVSGNF